MRGIVDSLYRYPIKSLLGEPIEAGHFGERGLVGDRAFAFIDEETGKVASAKEPRRWSMMLEASAKYADDAFVADASTVSVSFPDGQTMRANDPALVSAMLALVGRAVRLVSAPPEGAVINRVTPEGEDDAGSMVELPVAGGAPAGTLFDFAPVHLVSTASLGALQALHPQHMPSYVQRFRPNIVLALDSEDGFVESGWIDRTLSIGKARFRILCATPRCAVPTLQHGDEVPRDPDLIRTLARNNRVPVPGFGNLSCLGAYATVVEPGVIAVGDRMRLD